MVLIPLLIQIGLTQKPDGKNLKLKWRMLEKQISMLL